MSNQHTPMATPNPLLSSSPVTPSGIERRDSGAERFSLQPMQSALDSVTHVRKGTAPGGSGTYSLPSITSDPSGYQPAFAGPEGLHPAASPNAAGEPSRALQILSKLPSMAEFYGVAHRASINPLDEGTKMKFRKTGIVCTIGPKTNTPEALAMLRQNGMNVMRMNFSHGTHAYHASVIDNLRKSFGVFKGPPVAIALDTKGPEIRTGNMTAGTEEAELHAGQSVEITTDAQYKDACTAERIYVDYANLPKVVKAGSLIYIDDGLISIRVVEVNADGVSVKGEVVNTGVISSHKGVNLPGTVVDLPSVSEQDKRDLQFGVEQGVDIVFASFIRKPEDVAAVRAVLGPKGARIMIISKIENQEGLHNFDRILDVSDGIMVARGDLGIEIPVQKVFLAQKMMIARCNVVGKPVICATQMLESMTVNPRPTRAEASDVANAVIDGSDAVMLSGETAKGKYPGECVRMMHDLCVEAEGTLHFRNVFGQIVGINKQKHTNETLAAAAVQAAFDQEANALIVLSVSGNTARLVAKYRPRAPIICVTTDEITARQLHMTRGVYPVLYPQQYNSSLESWGGYIDSMVKFAIVESSRDGVNLVKRNDVCVVVQGWACESGHTNTLRVIRV